MQNSLPKVEMISVANMKKRITHLKKELERVAGIEPARSAWEADRLPLHHTRLALFITI